MIITTVKDLTDGFKFYPDKLSYFDKSDHVEDEIYQEKEMEDFFEHFGDRELESFEIRIDGPFLTLDIAFK